jgi:hypothetical protein
MRKISVGLVVMAVVVGAMPAYAGLHTSLPVTVSPLSMWGEGILSSVFLSADTIQGLECIGQGSNSLICYAQDATGNSVMCTLPTAASPPPIIQTLAAMTSDAEVVFFFNSSGTCTSLQLTVASSTPPK